MPSWRHMSQQVWLRRLALTAIAALAGLLYAWAPLAMRARTPLPATRMGRRPAPSAVITLRPVGKLLPAGGVPSLSTPAVRLAAPLASAGPAEPWAGSSWPASG